MSVTPAISVVIPAKNRAHTLPQCLDSILNQTFPAAEIIVVDDGSSDNTFEVVRSYQDRGVIYTKLSYGHGAQAARNAGIRRARHNWIAFQDSDDCWLADKLELQIEALSSSDAPDRMVVHTDGYRFDSVLKTRTKINVGNFSGGCYNRLLITPGPMFPSILVHRDRLEEIGLLDENCLAYQEWDTAIRLARVCEWIHIRKPLFDWSWHAGETISKDARRELIGFRYVINKHRAEIMSVHGPRAWELLETGQLVKAIRRGLYDEVSEILSFAPPRISYQLLRWFTEHHYCPPGAISLLKLTAHLTSPPSTR